MTPCTLMYIEVSRQRGASICPDNGGIRLSRNTVKYLPKYLELLSLWTFSVVRYKKATTFRKCDLLSSSGKNKGEGVLRGNKPNQLGPFE
jgi:hypothetical protein